MIEPAADEMRCRGLPLYAWRVRTNSTHRKHTGHSLLDWFREPITEFNAVLGTRDDKTGLPLQLHDSRLPLVGAFA
jgi:hypothetical protein